MSLIMRTVQHLGQEVGTLLRISFPDKLHGHVPKLFEIGFLAYQGLLPEIDKFLTEIYCILMSHSPVTRQRAPTNDKASGCRPMLVSKIAA